MDLFARANELIDKLDSKSEVKAAAKKNLATWLNDDALTGYRPYIEHLVEQGNAVTLLDGFWRMIPFGTGGRRGPVGAGPNRINPHTINLSVQGHCDYLKKKVRDGEIASEELRVVVAYDVRQFFDLKGVYGKVSGPLEDLTSRDMARSAACTYAANGIAAYVIGPLANEPGRAICTDKYISTPELSFLIRELGAAGGLNVSASHNYPDDNGGKFYNEDGGQEIPPHDETLLELVEKVTRVETMAYERAREENRIRFIPQKLHETYLDINAAYVGTESRSARVAFTPLCGVGMNTVNETLLRLGFDVKLVEEQANFDGSFESVRFRIGNPEVPESMDKLEVVARREGCIIGFATDPDADRLGIIVPDGAGGFTPVNGNEIGLLLLESLISQRKREGTLPVKPIFINTAVTSGLQREIARRYGCQVIGDLMVGFKYMGDVLRQIEQHGRFPVEEGLEGRDRVEGDLDDFVLTCEESHGYLVTPRVRDKDACGAAVHLAGLASRLEDEGRSMIGMLRDIYRVYGYRRNALRSLVMEGIVGLDRIGEIQSRLREDPPREIAGMRVLRFVDNQKVGGPIKSSTDAASRNVLLFELDGKEGRVITVVVRPSGTEPKTKIYVEVPAPGSLGGTLFEASREQLAAVSDEDLDRVIKDTNEEATRIGNAFIRDCLGPKILGDVYPEIPDASLLVSDLIPVDAKIRLFTEIMPAIAERFSEEGEDARGWAVDQLGALGEDPAGLAGVAIEAWLEEARRAGRFTDDTMTLLASML